MYQCVKHLIFPKKNGWSFKPFFVVNISERCCAPNYEITKNKENILAFEVTY